MRIPALLLAASCAAQAPAPTPGVQAPPPLVFSATAEKQTYAPGEPILLRLVLDHPAGETLRLFQPDAVDRLWPSWRVEGSVRRPDGKECPIEPEIRYSLLGTPRARHFLYLVSGGRLELPIAFRSAEPREGAWTALLPVAPKDARQTPEALRKRYGFAGAVAFVGSGKQEYLSLQDPGDLFRERGVYSLRFTYSNRARGFLETEGGRSRYVAVPAAWNGTLETGLRIEIR